MARVVVSATADSDRQAILDYLVANAGYATADRYNAEFKGAFRRLAEFPDIGSPRPLLSSFMRIAVVHPFVVFYEHRDDCVTIFRLLHAKRNITPDLLRPRSGL
jgi:toxin ParE1/3/4